MINEEDYIFATFRNPSLPSFVSGEIDYLGLKELAESLKCLSTSTPKDLLFKGSREITERNWTYTHTNTWGYPYEVKAKTARAVCHYFRIKREYVRAVQFYFSDLCYLNSLQTAWNPLTAADCWGNRGILTMTDIGQMTNLLFFLDKEFNGLSDMKADMADPQDLGYKLFFNEIFADVRSMR